MRAAKRAGDDRVAIVKACIAAEAKSVKGGALLDAVSTDDIVDVHAMFSPSNIKW
jgi:hypothetical protein